MRKISKLGIDHKHGLLKGSAGGAAGAENQGGKQEDI